MRLSTRSCARGFATLTLLLGLVVALALPASASAQDVDLAIDKYAPTVTPPDQEFAYTLIISTNGTGDATGVVVTDTLPSNVEFVGADGAACTAAGPDPRVVTCEVGDLGLGDNRYINIYVRPLAEGLAVNVATITGDQNDPDQTNNTGQAAGLILATAPEADLNLTGTGPANALVGQPFTYEFELTNDGPDAVVDAEILFSGVRSPIEFVSSTGAVCVVNAKGRGSCEIGVISPGETVRVTVTVVGTGPGNASPCFHLNSSFADPDFEDNSVCIETTIADDPDTDGDGVRDSVDNCDDVANPSQRDDDQDGIGDACDDTFDSTDGKANGGGWLASAGGKVTFAASAKSVDGRLAGNCVVTVNKTKIKCLTVDGYFQSPTSDRVVFVGTALHDGAATRYRIEMTDDGEPGGTDRFEISTDSGFAATGVLGGGNIQVH